MPLAQLNYVGAHQGANTTGYIIDLRGPGPFSGSPPFLKAGHVRLAVNGTGATYFVRPLVLNDNETPPAVPPDPTPSPGNTAQYLQIGSGDTPVELGFRQHLPRWQTPEQPATVATHLMVYCKAAGTSAVLNIVAS